MASSSTAAAGSDLARQPRPPPPPPPAPLYPLAIAGLQSARSLGSVSMDDLLRNIYGDGGGGAGGEVEGASAPTPTPPGTRCVGSRMVEEVWREISGGRKLDDGDYGEMTLEDFLARAGAVREEDVRVSLGAGPGVFGVDHAMPQPVTPLENPILGFGNEMEGGGGERGRGRRRKRPVLDPVDRAALQRQKRMIKNRESAARSRERKQAYTLELESLVTQLEEENAKLLREQEEHKAQRLKQLMENLIPVTEEKRPPRILRRTHSLQW